MEKPAPTSELNLCQATTPSQLAAVRALFLEYAASLEISLCFQNFERELASLPGSYAARPDACCWRFAAIKPPVAWACGPSDKGSAK